MSYLGSPSFGSFTPFCFPSRSTSAKTQPPSVASLQPRTGGSLTLPEYHPTLRISYLLPLLGQLPRLQFLVVFLTPGKRKKPPRRLPRSSRRRLGTPVAAIARSLGAQPRRLPLNRPRLLPAPVRDGCGDALPAPPEAIIFKN